jgi:hypothetical protein
MVEEQFVQSPTQPAPVSMKILWAGRIISGLVTLFMLFDASIKIMKLTPAVEGTVQLGYPVGVVLPLGVVLLICVVVYSIPRTSIVGAILLTGFLGGATATQVRMENPWFLFPMGIGVLAWVGLYLRDERLRALIPLRTPKAAA